MNKFVYRLTYWLGQTHWDTGETPPEVVEAFKANDIPSGPALDLGCGTGTNTIFMAQQGRQAIGIDFVPQAVAKARIKARLAGVSDRTQFYAADVTRLGKLHLPLCSFALDMGCFHGLSQDGQHSYIEGLAALLQPGGRSMLYTLNPRREVGVSFGMLPEHVQSVFASCFDILRVESGSFWGQGSTWFWMKRKV